MSSRSGKVLERCSSYPRERGVEDLQALLALEGPCMCHGLKDAVEVGAHVARQANALAWPGSTRDERLAVGTVAQG